VTAEDVKAVMLQLVEKAKQGDVSAAREVLARVLGKPKVEPVGRPEQRQVHPGDFAASVIAQLHAERTLP
jgi:hypothetical protein